MLEINAGAYSFEAANACHEHEWRVWEDLTLPEGKLILFGIVGHGVNVVEHPELVAERIETFASVVGRKDVIASTEICWRGVAYEQRPMRRSRMHRSAGRGHELASTKECCHASRASKHRRPSAADECP